MTELRIPEWSCRGPADTPELFGRSLPDAIRPACELLAASGRVEILELARGLEIRSSSWVGRLQLGDIELIIEPKIQGLQLATLLQYAYGLRDLRMHPETVHASARNGMRDLLILQFIHEVHELRARGLHKDYERRADDLASPRGRIDFGSAVDAAARGRATLSCTYHPRTEDNWLNGLVLGGLRLCVGVTRDRHLRWEASRAASLIGASVRPHDPSLADLNEAEARTDRRHHAYLPSLRILRLLLEGRGTSLAADAPVIALPGFLFDMNAFFQRLVSRLLLENLEGYEVRNEQSIRGMFAWDRGFNPLDRRAPAPRPDFVIHKGDSVVSVLDAKYRDLWNTGLPREMLYQLALYAAGHPSELHEASILYPTVEKAPAIQSISLRDCALGRHIARVILRPIDVSTLAIILAQRETSAAMQIRELARAAAGLNT